MRALVLSGGGVKGAYQLGVLRRWLLEERREYDIFSGVSVGALNSAVLAQVPYGDPEAAYQHLARTWSSVDNSTVRRDWPLFGKLAALWKGHLYDSSPLMDWVRRDVLAEDLAKSGKKLFVGTTCLNTGEYRVVRENTPDIWKWVYASAAFPLFFQEMEIGGQLWVDGGVRTVTPLADVLKEGATEIDVILTSDPDHLPSPWNHGGKKIWGKVFRILDLVMSEITLTDLQVVGLKNDLAQLGSSYRPVRVRLIYPGDALVSNAMDFDPRSIRAMQERGYRDALSTSQQDLSEYP